MTTTPRTIPPITLGRFFRLIGGVAAATVGLLFLIIGVNLLATEQWATATGTVSSCTASTTGTGSSRHVEQLCTIAWQEAGKAHSDKVPFGTKPVHVGQTSQIKVSGDNAVLPAPAWVAIVTSLVGAALIGTCIFLFVRSRRAAATSP